MTVHTMPDRSFLRGQVAGEARAEMARQKYTINQLPHLLGKSQSYWSRRLNGDQPMDVDDLAMLASLLKVPVTRFFETAESPDPPSPTDGPSSNTVEHSHHSVLLLAAA